MAQSTILAPGITASPSADVVVAFGEIVKVGIFSATPSALAPGEDFSIQELTPGAPNYLGALSNSFRSTQLIGPGTFRVNRPALAGPAFGVYKDI